MKKPLKTIIAEFISSADLSEHQFMRLWNIGVRGMQEFNMDIIGNIKTVLLAVNDNKTVDFPKDFLTLSKLGILNDVGEVVTLTENNNMSTLHQQYVAQLGQLTDVPVIDNNIIYGNPTRFPFLWLNYWGYGSDLGYHLYGLQGGTPVIGEYKVDEISKTIYLSDSWPYTTLLMEYLSDGYDCDGQDYMVDVRASEALISYIRWNNAKDLRKKFTTADVEYYRRQYYNERRLAKMRLNRVDVDQMQKVFRSHVKLVAKA